MHNDDVVDLSDDDLEAFAGGKSGGKDTHLGGTRPMGGNPAASQGLGGKGSPGSKGVGGC